MNEGKYYPWQLVRVPRLTWLVANTSFYHELMMGFNRQCYWEMAHNEFYKRGNV